MLIMSKIIKKIIQEKVLTTFFVRREQRNTGKSITVKTATNIINHCFKKYGCLIKRKERRQKRNKSTKRKEDDSTCQLYCGETLNHIKI